MHRPNGGPKSQITDTQFIHEWAEKLAEDGWDVIDASRGRPTYPTDAVGLDALVRYAEETRARGTIPYGTNALGELSYRTQVAESFEAYYGMRFNPHNIVFTPGGQFGLAASFYSILYKQPGGIFLTPRPWYLNHRELARMVLPMVSEAQREIFHPIELMGEHGVGLRAEAVQQAIDTAERPIAGFLFCNPGNPLGNVTRKQDWLEIAEVLRAHPDVPVMLDEAFTEVVFDGDRAVSLLQAAPELLSRCFLFRSGTKALGFPGERLAVMHVPERWLEALNYLQSRWIGNPPLSGQEVMATILSQLDSAKLDTITAYYRANAERLMGYLRELGMELHPDYTPEGGFFTLADFSRLRGVPMPKRATELLGARAATMQTDWDIMAALLSGFGQQDKESLALIPASCFGMEAEKCLMRVSFSITADEIDALRGRLSAMLKALSS